MLLDYVHTYPNPEINKYANDMCLHLDSNGAYLVQPKAHSVVAGHNCLSNRIPKESKTPDHKHNGPIRIEYKTNRNIIPQ